MSRALLVAALLVSAAGCSTPCRDGTILLTVDLGGLGTVDAIDVDTGTLHGSRPLNGTSTGTIELAFAPGTYPNGETLVLTLTARSNGSVVGTTTVTVRLKNACETVAAGAFTATSTDGGVSDLTSDITADLASPDLLQPEPSYGALTDTTRWSVFDTTTVNANATSYSVVAFDGRRMLFGAPGQIPPGQPHAALTEYDTSAAFTSPSAWKVTDLSTVSGELFYFRSAAFDGTYLYLATAHYSTARWDTRASASSASSWGFGPYVACRGMVFDGRYVYQAPNYEGVFLSGVLRYDSMLPFNSSGFTSFDATNVNANAKGFSGAVFDGRYFYMAPGINGVVTRYDTRAGFSSVLSWNAFDVSTLNAAAVQFNGAVYDGRYLYFIPSGRNGQSLFLRYDPQGAFDVATSWTIFDTLMVSPNAIGFANGVFDGRYLYFVPWIDQGQGHNGQYLTRYDTHAPFTSKTSWEVFDTTTVHPAARNFCMGGFDGAAVYLAPCASGLVTRFAAKTPASVPTVPPTLPQGIASFF
jgi:hypothetical protein